MKYYFVNLHTVHIYPPPPPPPSPSDGSSAAEPGKETAPEQPEAGTEQAPEQPEAEPEQAPEETIAIPNEAPPAPPAPDASENAASPPIDAATPPTDTTEPEPSPDAAPAPDERTIPLVKLSNNVVMSSANSLKPIYQTKNPQVPLRAKSKQLHKKFSISFKNLSTTESHPKHIDINFTASDHSPIKQIMENGKIITIKKTSLNKTDHIDGKSET